MDAKTALLYAKLKQYQFLVRKTEGFIKWALKNISAPYVACSFGKDSAVMLHMILKFAPDIPIRFVRWAKETSLIDNYDEIIVAWGPINLTQIELSRDNLSDKRANRYNTDGFDSYFIGLRKDESTARRITLKKDGKFYKNKSGMTRISPLADWTKKDVAAYACSNNLPILGTYIANGFSARTASRIPRADYGIRASFLTDLKNRDIDAYNKLVSYYPELSTFV